MNSSYATLYLVRHGESVWNVKGVLQGQMQFNENALTQKGETQAKNISSALQHIHFKALFSSDLMRAKRTAEIIGLEKNLVVQTTEALREKSHGEYEGTNSKEYLKLFTKWAEISDEERLNYKVTDKGESPNEALIRFMLFLREVAVAYKGETVLIITHGGMMRDFLIKLGLQTYDSFGAFTNTGFIRLRSDGVEFFVDEMNGLK